jgi:hypothetical protein
MISRELVFDFSSMAETAVRKGSNGTDHVIPIWSPLCSTFLLEKASPRLSAQSLSAQITREIRPRHAQSSTKRATTTLACVRPQRHEGRTGKKGR